MDIWKLSEHIAPYSGVLAAVATVTFAFLQAKKADKRLRELEEFKGGASQDLERLKSKLGHGQLVDSTQWNAEFNAYQALWKSIVLLRPLADKLVMSHSELAALGLEVGDLSTQAMVGHKEQFLRRYGEASSQCMRAIYENAPFYPTEIRSASHEMHELAHSLFQIHFAGSVSVKKGQSFEESEAALFVQSSDILIRFKSAVNKIEEMIRKRLSEVRVVP